MLNLIYDKTLEYANSISKDKRKKIGQFFTEPPTAYYMASLINFHDNMKILDAGAGSGILAAAVCIKALEYDIKNISIDLYENDESILLLLAENMDFLKKHLDLKGLTLEYRITNENFILDNKEIWDHNTKSYYDVVISNPPYKKIGKNDEEALIMKEIVHGQPNIYFLFIAMATKLLKSKGQLISINPRSFTSGLYFSAFRKWFLQNAGISDIHLFVSRDNIFKSDKVLQEAVIIKAIKEEKVDKVNITTSTNADFNDIKTIKIETDKVIHNGFILIPSNEEEVEVLKIINSWDYDMIKLGLKLSTGKVVDFRAKEYIKRENLGNSVPLLWADNIKNNYIIHPVDSIKSPQYIANMAKTESLLMHNKNYLIIKRFSSKEEKRRLQPAIYLKETINSLDIAVDNKLNYINGNLSKDELYGLFTIFNSTLLDIYYRILNGSTQVNATEVNAIPLPNMNIIKELGSEIIKLNDLSTETCDNLILDIILKGKDNLWAS